MSLANQLLLAPTRRDLLRAGGGLAVASVFAPQFVRAAATTPARVASSAKARSCILIYLLGGPPHLDMFDLKPDAPAEIRDVRPPQRGDFPHVGSMLARHLPAPRGLPGYIAIPELAVRSSLSGEFKRVRQLLRGGAGGFLGPLVDPLPVNGDPGTPDAVPALRLPADVTDARLERRDALLSVLDNHGPGSTGTRTLSALRQQAVALSGASSSAAAIFSLDAEPAPLRERYGDHRFGRAMLLARRLAEAGVPMTAIHFNEMTICDGWDTHSKNFEALETELLPMVDQGLSALLDDLCGRGILDETLVVMMGEFGRTPRINANAGRDHWGSCQSVLLAGGGIRGGQVHGASDSIAAYPRMDPVDPIDIHATLFHCMGLSPEHRVLDALQRPQPMSQGRVIQAIV